MTKSLQELSDLFEIQQLPVAYANAIDTHDWDALDRVFTPDAFIDYRKMGGPDGRYPEIKQFLKQSLPGFPGYMHMVGNVQVTVTGDTASGRTACFNPMVCELKDGSRQVMFLGLWYLDEYVRTPAGWRFTKRVEQHGYEYNVPPGLKTSE
jgi:hypothetical protein